MNNLVFWTFLGLSCCLMIALGFCIHQAFVDNAYWLFTLLGILPSAGVSVLITAAAFSSREDR